MRRPWGACMSATRLGMPWEMSPVRAPRSSPPVPGGPLVALLTLAVVLLGSLTGNAFSMHAGMEMHSSVSGALQAENPSSVVAAEVATVAESGRHLIADVAGPMLPTSSDAQHLMHLVGACLALLAAAVVLILSVLQRHLDRHGDSAPLPSYGITLLTPATWVPPSLDPPTSSPVIRT